MILSDSDPALSESRSFVLHLIFGSRTRLFSEQAKSSAVVVNDLLDVVLGLIVHDSARHPLFLPLQACIQQTLCILNHGLVERFFGCISLFSHGESLLQ